MKTLVKFMIMVVLAVIVSILGNDIFPQYALHIGSIGGIIWGIVICQ